MSIQKTPDVASATSDDQQRIVDTLVLAFAADPMMRWFMPEPHEYLQHFPEFVQIYGGQAFEHETAYLLPDFGAAALWLPPGVQPDEETMVEFFQRVLPEERLAIAGSVLEELDALHPDEPYWHLPVIGVDPRRQRKGYGSQLMTHALAVCDREGTPAYLESSNPMNISLYARHGFEIVGMIQEGSMPPLIPMVREPRV